MKKITPFLTMIFILSVALTFIWTTIIGFSNGIIAGILTMSLPIISSLYWMIKMFGENNAYSYTVLVQLIVTALVYLLFLRKG